jgi:hypothetical protein
MEVQLAIEQLLELFATFHGQHATDDFMHPLQVHLES